MSAAGTTDYVLIDGGYGGDSAHPPRPASVIESTVQLPVTVTRTSVGQCSVTFPAEYRFLVGTSYGYRIGVNEYSDTILTAAKELDPRVWVIMTRDRIGDVSVDTMFGLIVRR
jgi:hypothetical protein